MVTVYTGPIDRFFNFKHGQLGWGTLGLEMETVDVEDFQGAPVMNYVEESVPFTRIHEFKYLHPEETVSSAGTVIYSEQPRAAGLVDEPYYPVNGARDAKILERYKSERLKNVYIGGRLGSYRYLDMDDTITEALSFFETELKHL